LHLSQQQFADRVRSSLRTVQRWEADRGRPQSWELQALADAVRPNDPQLASELDVWAPRPTPPAAPGVVVAAAPAPAPPLPAAPPPAPTPAPVLVDAIVCAAAEAMALAPQAVRPALLAAFSRARDVGLTPEAVVAVLAPSPPPAGEAKTKKRGA
jgi:hypothetical protein